VKHRHDRLCKHRRAIITVITCNIITVQLENDESVLPYVISATIKCNVARCKRLHCKLRTIIDNINGAYVNNTLFHKQHNQEDMALLGYIFTHSESVFF
jgi:hypothetical protein